MPDRKPEPWESGAAAPFLWIETPRGNVEVWALGEDRFRVRPVERAAMLAPANDARGCQRARSMKPLQSSQIW
jgi:hypothetical protein